MCNVSPCKPLRCLKCKKIDKKRSIFRKFAFESDIKDVCFLVKHFKVSNEKCDCGCFRYIKNIQSLLLQSYFSCKRRWINILNVSRRRIAELNEVSELVMTNGCTPHTFKLLDLDLVRIDLARQQWIQDGELSQLVEGAIITFCVVNNVGYWQGIHDVVAALVHLYPRPCVGELAAILEQLSRRYSPLLFLGSCEEVMYEAQVLSQRWKLLFKYFFPRGFNELDKISDFNSLGIGLFLTLGFYRFGCAYIALSYIYVMMLNQPCGLSDFMFHELGYLATRGHMKYLSKHNETFKSIIYGNILPRSLSHSHIIKILKNSLMVNIEAEEVINASKNLYDTMGGVECELYTFPLVYIVMCSNVMYRFSPSISKLEYDCDYMQISIGDILKERPNINSLECSFKTYTQMPNLYLSPCYRTRKIVRRHNFKFRVLGDYSVCVSSEMVLNYISSIRRNIRKIRKKNEGNTDYIIGSLANNVNYNVVDLRSPYMITGVPLETLFGVRNVTFIKENDVDNALSVSRIKQFTIWVVLTDEGIVKSADPLALESLNRGFHLMKLLCDNSITGVALLTNGYKGLLLTAKYQIPQTPNSNITSYLRRFVFWNSEDANANTTQIISRAFAATENTTLDLEPQFLRKFDNLFPRRKNIKGLDETINGETESNVFSRNPYTRLRKRGFLLHIKLNSSSKITLSSNGSIKINGIILHPYHYSKIKRYSGENLTISAAKLFAVNYVDRIWEVLPSGENAIGGTEMPLNEVLLSSVYHVFDKFIVRVEANDIDVCNISRKLIIATKVSNLSNSEKWNDIVKYWYMFLISKKEVMNILLSNELLFLEKIFRWFKTRKNYETSHQCTINDIYNSLENLKISDGAIVENSIPGKTAVPLLQDFKGVKVFSRRKQDGGMYKRIESPFIQSRGGPHEYQVPDKKGTNLRLTHVNSITPLSPKGGVKSENRVQKTHINVLVTRSSLIKRQK